MINQIEKWKIKDKVTFVALLLIARSAPGKSELINYLKGISFDERIGRYHITCHGTGAGGLKII
jgi:hypothetical protein